MGLSFWCDPPRDEDNPTGGCGCVVFALAFLAGWVFKAILCGQFTGVAR